MGASVVPQYLQRGGSTLAGLSLVGSSDCMTDQWLVDTNSELSRRHHDHYDRHGHNDRGDGDCCHYRRVLKSHPNFLSSKLIGKRQLG
jgi:hypothetical protein